MNWFLCRDLIDEKSHKFKGDFEENSQESSIPPALLSFVSCVMHGSSATSCKNEYYKQAILSVRQLMKYNTFIWTRKDSLSPDHSTQREPLLPVYLGLKIHKTQGLSLIQKLSKLGLCISKYRLSQLSISMGNILNEASERDGVVLPVNLKLRI